MKIHELFQGNSDHRGVYNGLDPNGKKLAYEQSESFDWRLQS